MDPTDAAVLPAQPRILVSGRFFFNPPNGEVAQ